MKKILNIFFIAIVLCGGIIGITHACSSNQIDIGNGNCENTKFTITTTNLNAGDEFKFYMSASGTFYVDCGDGGTLSGTGVSSNTIIRTNTDIDLYTCTYSTGGTKTIKMAGLATGYNSGIVSAIRFFNDTIVYTSKTPTPISAISGSIGQIFPTLGLNSYQQPLFYSTFMNSYITSIPENLFSGVSGATAHMFAFTFLGCANLTTIPEGLFSGISGAAEELFGATFLGCSNLTTIPEGLFSSISGVATGMFSDTFVRTGLTSIPKNLFSGVYGSAERMFAFTFYGIHTLSGYIPPSTFAGLIANSSPTASGMWNSTFDGTNLATSCPSGKTQYITGYEDYWSGKVSCVDANLTCSAGNYLPAHGYECAQCTANNYCVGGTYPYSATESHGITPCDTGYSSVAGASSCTGNVINITWEDATPESVAANNAGSCTYGGTINTPAVAPSKRGYVFTGWSFDTSGN